MGVTCRLRPTGDAVDSEHVAVQCAAAGNRARPRRPAHHTSRVDAPARFHAPASSLPTLAGCETCLLLTPRSGGVETASMVRRAQASHVLEGAHALESGRLTRAGASVTITHKGAAGSGRPEGEGLASGMLNSGTDRQTQARAITANRESRLSRGVLLRLRRFGARPSAALATGTGRVGGGGWGGPRRGGGRASSAACALASRRHSWELWFLVMMCW